MVATDPRRNGLAGVATISPGLDGNSIDFSVFLQGMPVVRKGLMNFFIFFREKKTYLKTLNVSKYLGY